jgi:hypothetical protein
MDYRQLFRDIFTLNFRGFRKRRYRLVNLIRRKISGQKINSVVPTEIPVIINNRDRFTYLLQLIEWLEKAGMKNIIILDNDSTYPPLLDYYSKTKYRVVKLGDNVGHLALWKCSLYSEIASRYYIYTDPDVVPVEDCPVDLPAFLLKQLKRYASVEKIGMGLKIDDLPDQYNRKQEVIDWEKRYWEIPVAEGVFRAEVDTTLALYRPYANSAKRVAPAYRTGPPYVARHLPWYEKSSDPGEENLYYAQHVRQGASYWISKT